MSLLIYNTLSRKKEEFVPLHPGRVDFYVCGVTVYDHSHVGHARAYVAFDVMRRYLEYSGLKVRFIQNFTDIDDKIINRSKEEGVPFDVLTARYIAAFFEDMDALNIKRANDYPMATKFVSQMIDMIRTLLEKGAAYELNGDVYFSVEYYHPYGQLSRKVLDELVAGIRVDVSVKKRNPLDFVLWKASKPGEPTWESPWGPGRPGWHIECSAMATSTLGPSIDIHGGGEDLIFPHHENEIAQSECATGKPFARYWVHNGFVTIRNEKMSKSQKNFFTIRDVLKKYSGEVLRFFLLRAHYRAPINFSAEGLEEAKQALERLRNTLRNHSDKEQRPDAATEEAFKRRFLAALDDDFNAAESLGVLFDLARHVNSTGSGAGLLRELGEVIGLFYEPLAEDTLSEVENRLIAQRQDARKGRDFKLADEIRDRLLNEHRLVVEDTPAGMRWKRV